MLVIEDIFAGSSMKIWASNISLLSTIGNTRYPSFSVVCSFVVVRLFVVRCRSFVRSFVVVVVVVVVVVARSVSGWC